MQKSRKITWHMINTLFLMYCSCRTYFCCLPLAFTNIHVYPWPLVLFFQISLKNNELKPPTIPFGIVACTFSNNLSQNRCNLCKHNNGFPVLSPRCLPSGTLKFSTTNGSLSLNNRPFPSSKKSHLQGEAKCEAIDMKMIFNYDANKTHFHNKGFALSLVLKVRVFGTRKWPIVG